jgi:hypothetical protein
VRRQRPQKKQPAPPQPRENIGTDKTPARHKLWNDLSVAITNAGQMGLERIAIIEDLMRQIENLVNICDQMGDDLTPLKDLM